jgi:hypothetical protein
MIIYSLLKELLSNNERNLIKRVIKVYTTLLTTKYRVTTLYYLRTNKIIKNFNGLLSNVLIKILIN